MSLVHLAVSDSTILLRDNIFRHLSATLSPYNICPPPSIAQWKAIPSNTNFQYFHTPVIRPITPATTRITPTCPRPTFYSNSCLPCTPVKRYRFTWDCLRGKTALTASRRELQNNTERSLDFSAHRVAVQMRATSVILRIARRASSKRLSIRQGPMRNPRKWGKEK